MSTSVVKKIEEAKQKSQEEHYSVVDLPVPHSNTHLQISFEVITPKRAKKWLENNHQKQRSKNQGSINQYANQMRKGLWYGDNGESIKFAGRDKTGKPNDESLVDGQHRLEGVILSEVPVTMMVIRGLEPSHILAMDLGKRRSLKDIMEMNGHQNVIGMSENHYSSVITGIFQVKGFIEYESKKKAPTRRRVYFSSNTYERKSPIQIYELFLKNPEIADRLIKLQGKKISSMAKRFAAAGSILGWYCVDILDSDIAMLIYDTMLNGVPQSERGYECPAFLAMTYIQNARQRRIKLSTADYVQAWLWAYDAIATGTTPKQFMAAQLHLPTKGHHGSATLKKYFKGLNE